jgi:clan AA aspartic protease (TIGR02281 family)
MKFATRLLIYALLCAVGAAAFGYAGIDDLLWSAFAAGPAQADTVDPTIPKSVPTVRWGQESPSRAVLSEEDANDPIGRQFVGTAVWRTDRVPSGRGQAPELAIRADIEIPEPRISVKWSLRRNDDKALPASHTVEIVFTLPADFPHGSIANIPGVLMKQGESTRGIPLVGLAVKVTTNFFLIGLSSINSDMQRNIQLLKERPWFDIPIVYGDGQRALIAVEKARAGESAFAEAFAAWEGKSTSPPLPPNPPPVARLEPSAPPSVSAAPTRGTVIPLQLDRGTFTIPVLINDKITLDFVLDSGAADVTIPSDVVGTLRRTGTLSNADFLGTKTYVLADGSKMSAQTFRIKSLKIGDRVIDNVTASTVPAEGSLLLGQSFLNRFKSWSIDNNRQVLVLQ